jgi:hypothetical protein
MKLTYDTDAILLQILKSDAALVAGISGGIYAGDRPDNSTVEDITINTPALTQDFLPQAGYSNVNVHVTDQYLQIGGVKQYKENRARLQAITGLVIQALKAARIEGLTLTVGMQSTVQESEIHQHYVNIRIEWNIH